MKTIITATALVFAAFAANAAPAPLVNTVQGSAGAYTDIDVTTLSDAQVAALHLIVNSGDSEGEKRAKIASLIR